MQITRRKDDNRLLPVSKIPKPDMPVQEMWAYPNASDLASRRLITCANKITADKEHAEDIRCYAQALDLSQHERNHGILSDLTDSQQQSVEKLLAQLSPSQMQAYNYIKETHHRVVLIQGPPGTGKTTLIVKLLQVLWELNQSSIVAAGSNPAVDQVVTSLEENCPEMSAILFYAYDNEARAIRRQEKQVEADEDSGAKEGRDQVSEEEDDADLDAAEKSRAFNSFMVELQNNDDEWKGRKLQRPNFKNMSLHYRAMQNAGLIKHNVPCFAPDERDIHKDFRTLLSNRDLAKNTSEEEKKAYKLAEDKLMKDTIIKSSTLIATLSKTADNKTNRVKKPVIAVVDEAC